MEYGGITTTGYKIFCYYSRTRSVAANRIARKYEKTCRQVIIIIIPTNIINSYTAEVPTHEERMSETRKTTKTIISNIIVVADGRLQYNTRTWCIIIIIIPNRTSFGQPTGCDVAISSVRAGSNWPSPSSVSL